MFRVEFSRILILDFTDIVSLFSRSTNPLLLVGTLPQQLMTLVISILSRFELVINSLC